jgi:hypothetical protein
VNGIAAKITQQVGVLFKHQDLDAGTPEEIAEHHASRTTPAMQHCTEIRSGITVQCNQLHADQTNASMVNSAPISETQAASGNVTHKHAIARSSRGVSNET